MKLHLNAKRIYDTYGEKLKLSRRDFYKAMRDLDKGIYPDQMRIQPGDYPLSSRESLALRALDILLEGNGWEAITPAETKNGYEICYLNFGDPYIPTILYCAEWKRPYKLALCGWGDYVK